MKNKSLLDIYDLPIEVQQQIMPAAMVSISKRRAAVVMFSLLTLAMDYATGPAIRFPAFYFPPIILICWYDGFVPGALLATVLALSRFSMRFIWPEMPWPLSDSLFTLAINLPALWVLAWFVARAGSLTREIRLLKGVLRICYFCDSIESSENRWVPIQKYLQNNSEAAFLYKLCPACRARKHRTP